MSEKFTRHFFKKTERRFFSAEGESTIPRFSEDRQEGDFLWFGETTSEWVHQTLEKNRLTLVFLIVIFGVLLLFLRVVFLQIIEHDAYVSRAENNRIKEKIIYGNRGLIFDRNGVKLVENVPQYSVWIVPSELRGKNKEELDEIRKKIISILPEDILSEIPDDLKNFVNNQFVPQLLSSHLDYASVVKAEALLVDTPGIDFRTRSTRQYLSDTSFSHVLGYVGSAIDSEVKSGKYDRFDISGKSGIEQYYESFLKGENGYIRNEIDALGREGKNVDRKLPVAGKDVVLTIDSALQEQVKKALEKQVQRSGARAAAALVVNPNNGEILASVSYPYYDANLLTIDKDKKKIQSLLDDTVHLPFFNRITSAEYPLGSIFKLVVSMAGLDTGLINKYWSVLSTGGISVNSFFFPDWKAGGHGVTNLRKAIAESVNTYFYTLGGGYGDQTGLGVQKIYEYAKAFGFGDFSHSDLPQDSDGLVPTPEWKQEKIGEKWYLGDTYNLSIGQGYLLVTPLQVLRLVSILASGGKFTQPHFMQRIQDEKGVTEEFTFDIKSLPFKSVDFDAVKEGMRETVLSGSGRLLNTLNVSSAGKTSTAQFGNEGKYHAWYAGFAPYENPELAFVVMLESVTAGGDRYAVPVVYDILNYYYNHVELP